MNTILITGANSFVGTNVAEWQLRSSEEAAGESRGCFA